jgi:hypothetical protein
MDDTVALVATATSFVTDGTCRAAGVGVTFGRMLVHGSIAPEGVGWTTTLGPEHTGRRSTSMMRLLTGLIRLALGAMIVASIGSVVAALDAKRRLVPHHDPEADEVALVAIFGPLAFRSRARAFRGGTIDCWYGGGTIDLREATLAPEGAHLSVKAVFGGAQLIVPETWDVDSNVVGLGGVGDARSTATRPVGAPRLTIDGFAAFGGFGIASELAPDQVRWLEENQGRVEVEDLPREQEVSPVG